MSATTFKEVRKGTPARRPNAPAVFKALRESNSPYCKMTPPMAGHDDQSHRRQSHRRRDDYEKAQPHSLSEG
jgi:hypothetical protein